MTVVGGRGKQGGSSLGRQGGSTLSSGGTNGSRADKKAEKHGGSSARVTREHFEGADGSGGDESDEAAHSDAETGDGTECGLPRPECAAVDAAAEGTVIDVSAGQLRAEGVASSVVPRQRAGKSHDAAAGDGHEVPGLGAAGPAEGRRPSAEDLQLQMLVAMGATPLTAVGAAGSAKQSSQLATFAPLEAAAHEIAWGLT